jgi:hypothetical protein
VCLEEKSFQTFLPDVIKSRNKRNAISLLGQLSTWILEMTHTIFALYLIHRYRLDTNSHFAAFSKLAEFTVIPIVQILCSPPLRKFILES